MRKLFWVFGLLLAGLLTACAATPGADSASGVDGRRSQDVTRVAATGRTQFLTSYADW